MSGKAKHAQTLEEEKRRGVCLFVCFKKKVIFFWISSLRKMGIPKRVSCWYYSNCTEVRNSGKEKSYKRDKYSSHSFSMLPGEPISQEVVPSSSQLECGVFTQARDFSSLMRIK